MRKHSAMSLYSWSTRKLEPIEWMHSLSTTRHHGGDELPMGYKLGEKEGGENYKIRAASLEIKAQLPRIQGEQYNIILDV